MVTRHRGRRRPTPTPGPLPFNGMVEIQEPVVTRDRFGGEVTTWTTVDTVWANVNVTGTSERFQNDAARDVPLRNATVRISYRADVLETWRVVFESVGLTLAWDIKGIETVGFRHQQNLFVQTDASRTVTP